MMKIRNSYTLIKNRNQTMQDSHVWFNIGSTQYCKINTKNKTLNYITSEF